MEKPLTLKRQGFFFLAPGRWHPHVPCSESLRFRLFFLSQLKIDDFNEAHPAPASGLVFDNKDLFDLLECLFFFHQGLDSGLLFFDALNQVFNRLKSHNRLNFQKGKL